LPCLGVSVGIVCPIDHIDVEDGQFRNAANSFSPDHEKPSFGIPGHRTNVFNIPVFEVSPYDTADAVNFATKSTSVELVGRQAAVCFIVRRIVRLRQLSSYSFFDCSFRGGVTWVYLDLLEEE
jgi:hypothetical protein